jgi:RNA-directed DNA polymerase
MWGKMIKMGGCWLVEVDEPNLFGEVKYNHLSELFKERVCNFVLLLAIGKCQKA